MLDWKPTVNLSKLLPSPSTPSEPPQPAAVQSPAPVEIAPPTPILSPQAALYPVSPIGDGLRGYVRHPNIVGGIHQRDIIALRYPRLTKAVNAGVNLFLCPEAEKTFLALSLPYICLGTADNTEYQAEWSDMMDQPAITFRGNLE